MLSRVLLQPGFGYDVARLRYLDSSLRNAHNTNGNGASNLSEAEYQEFTREVELLQRELDRAQRSMLDVFQTLQNLKTAR